MTLQAFLAWPEILVKKQKLPKVQNMFEKNSKFELFAQFHGKITKNCLF
jgi:hypothetical protein